MAAWAPAAQAILLDAEIPEPSEYEVNIYVQDEFRLVAAVELVSPSNKDRAENRQTFVNKCEALLKKDVCVTIVDPVTNGTANLYGSLDELDAPRTAVSAEHDLRRDLPGSAAGPRWRLESWEHELAIGAAVRPALWLSPDLMVPLELEATYGTRVAHADRVMGPARRGGGARGQLRLELRSQASATGGAGVRSAWPALLATGRDSGKTEADAVVLVGRLAPEFGRRPAVLAVGVPAAAPDHVVKSQPRVAAHHCHTLPCMSHTLGCSVGTHNSRRALHVLPAAMPHRNRPLKFACSEDRSLVGLAK